MTWFLLTLACILLWGITDILFKASYDYDDPLSHCKSFVWVGVVMLLAGGIMALWSETLPSSIEALKQNLYLIPLGHFYAAALFFALLGFKYLDASIISCLENIDNALAAILMILFFTVTGNASGIKDIGITTIIATVIIVVGVVFLGIQEHTLAREEAALAEDRKKHRLGALALIFPLLYNLVDALSITAIGVTVSDASEYSIPDKDFFVFECAAFVVVAICVWLYMLIVKKCAYNPFDEEELVRCGAASGETAGTMTFIFAASENPVLTAPITSFYCIVTIILGRIFLKERLTNKQYRSLALLLIGILLLGISEIIHV